jgi:hypothetical protein
MLLPPGASLLATAPDGPPNIPKLPDALQNAYKQGVQEAAEKAGKTKNALGPVATGWLFMSGYTDALQGVCCYLSESFRVGNRKNECEAIKGDLEYTRHRLQKLCSE